MDGVASVTLPRTSLEALVSALPEQYQPIFGHPELTYATARACEDRLEIVAQVWEKLSAGLRRPARVLDLGCSQGYFSLALAGRGATVMGIDHGQANIAVCEALAAEYPQFPARFVLMNVEELFGNVDLGTFDLVLGLSIFHHLVRVHGLVAVERWLATLAKCVPTVIFELALAQEPTPWAAAQPKDERTLLSSFAFTHELARVPTHLSEVRRPLFFASNYAWYLDGHIDTFTSMTFSSHDSSAATCGGTRQYFMNERLIAKVFSLRDSYTNLNQLEIDTEAEFLAKPPEQFAPVPKVLRYGKHEHEIWLLRERLPGELLYRMIVEEMPYDGRRVIHDILKQLVALEAAGFAHNDLRTWNVLIMPDGAATLIDYGSISVTSGLYSWPCNPFWAFWLFAWCVLTKSKWSGLTLLPQFICLEGFPDPYTSLVGAFGHMPASGWTFAKLLEDFEAVILEGAEPCNHFEDEIWRHDVRAHFLEMLGMVAGSQPSQASAAST